MGSGIGVGTVLLAGLDAKKSAELIFAVGGALAVPEVDEETAEALDAALAGLAMTV